MKNSKTKSFSKTSFAPCSSYKSISEPNQIERIGFIVHDMNSLLLDKQIFFQQLSWMFQSWDSV